MLSYCLMCKKILRVLIQKFLQLVMVEQRYYQNVLYAVVKNQNLLKKTRSKRIIK